MKSLIAAAAAICTLLVSGCSGNWFGDNPRPEPTPTCDVPAHSPVPRPSLFAVQRPPATPAGWGWIILRLEVRTLALDTNGLLGNDYCSSVHITVKGVATEFDLAMINGAGVPTPERGFNALTPWVDYFEIQYDPSLERFQGRPPQYEVHVTAEYLSEIDHRRPADAPDSIGALAVGCSIYLGNDVNPIAHDVRGLPGTAQCDLYTDQFNYS